MLKKQLLSYLPTRLQVAVAALPQGVDETATELRLRLCAPASVTAGGKNRCFDERGKLCAIENAICCSEEELRDCVALLTESSLYSFGESIKQGFLPFGEGNRAGICGDGIVKNGALYSFRRIYGINLRVSRHVRECGFKAVRRMADMGFVGALVISPPGGGKTTLLRSIAALLAEGAVGVPKRVALADERAELFVPQLRRGLVDVISGVPKAQAMELLCRSMAPQYLICDEISSAESPFVLQAMNAGVSVVASVHAETKEALEKRPFAKPLLESGAFPLLISLKENYNYEIEVNAP